MPFYHGLLSDRPRIEAFRTMIHHAVGPGKTVVEIGAGLGTYSVLAAQAGARRVWAVESEPVIHVAEQIARVNGFEDRIEFIRGSAPDVDLPERADVLIFEDFPTRLLDGDTVALLKACADKYLKPSGTVLPGWARLNVAPVRAGELWASLFPFGPGNFEAFGIDWTPSAGYAENEPATAQLGFDTLVADPIALGEVPIHPSPEPGRLGGTAQWHPQAGAVHGIAYWFDLWAGGTTWLSNAPGAGGAWGQLFLPFREPVDMPLGTALDTTIEVMDLDGTTPGWMSWESRVTGPTGAVAVRRGHEFAGRPASLEDLFQTLQDTPAPAVDPAPPTRPDDDLLDGLTVPVQ